MAGALKRPGQGISVPSETDEGLFIANALIDGMKTENLLIIYNRRTYQQMNANQSSYGVGPGQDFNIERPEHIRRASFILPNQNSQGQQAEITMEPIFNDEQWQAFVTKQITSSNPLAFYYQPSVPFGTFRVWPVPNSPSQVVIYTPQYLSEFSTVDDDCIFPDGFREMLLYNIAVAVHERYPEKPMDPSVAQKAIFYKERVKYNLLTPMFISADPAVMQETYNARWSGGMPRAWLPPWY